MKTKKTSIPFRVLCVVYLLSILTAYLTLHNRYRPIDVDDPWYSSIYYDFSNKDISNDFAFGDPHNGVHFFGKTHALLVGVLFNKMGWTRTNSHILSTLFLVLGLMGWLYTLKRFQYSVELMACFGLAALFADPFFTAATSARPDAYCFMLASAALVLFIRGNFFVSMMVTWLGLETSPISAAALFYMAAVVLSSPGGFKAYWKGSPRDILALLAGFLIGLSGYLALHFHALSGLPGLLFHENAPEGRQSFGSLFEYFFRTKYYRHLPELALVAVSLGIYWRKKVFKTERFTWILFAILIVAQVLLRRPNFHYTVFFYPALLLMMLRTFEVQKALIYFMAAFWLLMAPPYLYAYAKNKSFDLDRELMEIQKALPVDNLPVVGPANEWFALHDREYYYYDFSADYQKLPLKGFYLVEDDIYRGWNSPGMMKDWLEKEFVGETLSRLEIKGQIFEIQKMHPKSKTP